MLSEPRAPGEGIMNVDLPESPSPRTRGGFQICSQNVLRILEGLAHTSPSAGHSAQAGIRGPPRGAISRKEAPKKGLVPLWLPGHSASIIGTSRSAGFWVQNPSLSFSREQQANWDRE